MENIGFITRFRLMLIEDPLVNANNIVIITKCVITTAGVWLIKEQYHVISILEHWRFLTLYG